MKVVNRQWAVISRFIVCFMLWAALYAYCSAADAQQSGKTYRVGFLFAGRASVAAGRLKAFREALYERGYVEGKNLAIEARYGDGKSDHMHALAAELLHHNVDVILTGGPTDTRAAKETTNTTPIVMAQDSEPVGSGFVASLARPGGNITGLSTLSPEISGKQVELLRETLPKLSRLAVLGNATEPGNEQTVRETRMALGAFGAQLVYIELRGREDLANALSEIKHGDSRAVIVLRNPIASTLRMQIVDFMTKSRLPGMYVSPEWVESGGLMSYASELRDAYRRAAIYVDRILKGANPAELPVEQPTKFEFVINLKTAKQIGLRIPPNVLARADHVIK